MPSTIVKSYKRNCFIPDPQNVSLHNAKSVTCIIYKYKNDGFVTYAKTTFEKSKKNYFNKTELFDITNNKFETAHKTLNVKLNSEVSYEKQIVKKILEAN